MELKAYQQKVIADLKRYLELLNELQDYKAAFLSFWQENSAPLLGQYHDVTPGVPNLCFKVPTGGGKTFLACNAIKPVFDALPHSKTKAVVWLVPSDAILTQTLAALKDTHHPYRQKIDVHFGSRVEVYSKQELLNGQNFNPTAVAEQLSIMVLSYDSFRGRSKDALKAFQENSNLAPFAQVLGKPEQPIENADETALYQIINQLSPLVIVDESHHARSELSLEMLNNFNPCFVLDLTATPKQKSNIISYVDAVQLKAEHMVKLPVIVYNRDNKNEVLTDAIDLRNSLEELAVAERARTGDYIRPIALFQAEPKGKEDATTFQKLRDELVSAGIPSEQIAIRTAEINDLKGVDLLSPLCPVRYIITINALKEGWDCPFAYVLASLANKTSQIDVEQILGRILRLPYVRDHKQPSLNMSYVLTSSNDFDSTVRQVIKGLNNAGFSDKDYRLAEPIAPKPVETPPVQTSLPMTELAPPEEAGDFSDVDGCAIREALSQRKVHSGAGQGAIETMLTQAEQMGEAYNRAIEQGSDDSILSGLPWEVRDKVTSFRVKPEFREDTESMLIPQFYRKIPESLFAEGQLELLEKDALSKDFTLKGKAYDIDFGSADDEMAQIDVRQSEGGLPKVFKMSSADQQYFKEHFHSLPQESRVRQCKDIMFNQLNHKLDMVDSADLRNYINRIVGDMDVDQIAAMEKAPLGYASKIKEKIDSLLTQHYKMTFSKCLETEEIVCLPSYRLPSEIHPISSTTMFGGSLYEAEEDMNPLEQKLVMELTAMSNVRWWHRNISRHGFYINGYINHYPDIMFMTQGGKVILAETKGGHLKNDDSEDKIALGRLWQSLAGRQFRYYMVFDDGVTPPDGALTMSQFVEIVKAL